MSDIGHNSGGIAGEALQQYVDRIERLEEERKAISEDIKAVKAESKSNGFDQKILNKILAIRKKAEHEAREEHELLVLYSQALGMDIFS